jgi:type I site-specific restriction-modification system R (restriction) subunit
VRKKALQFFISKAGEILTKPNIKSNKKRIKKNLQKFEDLLKEECLNCDESTILELVLDLPALLDITTERQKKKLASKLLKHIQWERVGYKALIHAYISDYVPEETIKSYALE